MGIYLEEAVELIETQQKGIEHTAPWMVGEQLKDICRREPAAAELLARDLKIKEMSLQAAEQKIKAWADRHKTGNCACVPPSKAEEILREFYGLQKPGGAAQDKPSDNGVCIDLMDFLG